MNMTKLSFKRSLLQVLLIALVLIFGVSLKSDRSVKETGKYEAELNAAQADQNTPKTENEIRDARGKRENELQAYFKKALHTPWTKGWYSFWANIWGMSERLWKHDTIKAHIHWASWTWFSAIVAAFALWRYTRIGKKILEDDNHGQRNKVTVSKLDAGVLFPQATFVLTLILLGVNVIGSLVKAPILLTALAAALIMIIEYLVYSTNGGKLASWDEITDNMTAPFRDSFSSVLGFLHINVETNDRKVPKDVRKKSRKTAHRAGKRDPISW